MFYPDVEEEFETIRTILKDNCSIARFGDGEFRIAAGKKGSCTQISKPKLTDKLKRILDEKIDGLIVGIPRISGRHDLKKADAKRYGGWINYSIRKDFLKLLNPKMKYYSAFISRADSAPHILCEQYWDLCKKMWKKRDVVVVEGTYKTRFTNYPQKGFLDNVKSLKIITGPGTDAFDSYDSLMTKVIDQFGNDRLIILSLGATATIMACDLHSLNYQALDLGRMSAFYNQVH